MTELAWAVFKRLKSIFPFTFFLGFGKCIILDHFTKHTGK